METTIEKLKVGDKLIMGRYGANPNRAVSPIVWLKSTPENKFLSESALDILPYDARESASEYRYSGNPDYETSNILLYLNSEESEWFMPMHRYDAAPTRGNVNNRYAYDTHPGFLSGFSDYEIESIVGRMELPSTYDIIGGEKFSLFKRKGIRARASNDLAFSGKLNTAGYNGESFIPFWTKSRSSGMVRVISRTGGVENKYPESCIVGLRPVCTLNPNTRVEGENGVYSIIPREIKKQILFTNEQLCSLLGI